MYRIVIKTRYRRHGPVMIEYFYIRRKLDVIIMWLWMWQRTGSYSPDINRFRRHTGNDIICVYNMYGTQYPAL